MYMLTAHEVLLLEKTIDRIVIVTLLQPYFRV
jgi:hypothetical protein